jgi:hypothetical protein
MQKSFRTVIVFSAAALSAVMFMAPVPGWGQAPDAVSGANWGASLCGGVINGRAFT